MRAEITHAPELVLLVSIAVLGALVHATSQLKLARDNNDKFTFVDFIILLPLGAFSGIMFAFIGLAIMPDQPYIIGAFTGVGSSAGMAGLNKLFTILLEIAYARANINSNINKKGDEKIN